MKIEKNTLFNEFSRYLYACITWGHQCTDINTVFTLRYMYVGTNMLQIFNQTDVTDQCAKCFKGY